MFKKRKVFFFLVGLISFFVIAGIFLIINSIRDFSPLEEYIEEDLKTEVGTNNDLMIDTANWLVAKYIDISNRQAIDEINAIFYDLDYGVRAIKRSPINSNLSDIEIDFSNQKITEESTNGYTIQSNLDVKGTTKEERRNIYC
ncbi:hypothetical protein [Ornithinibacillus sp. JPR2-1]|uniref:hypothetical protein n=1 Tax=Ornithinibacillus sp. JPR2-1 TaxID=2094019 RepID=UPI0031D8A983